MGSKSAVATQAQVEKRAAMIAEAAYFAAEQRNFQPGDELSDWLAAEQMVDSTIVSAKKPRARAAAKKPGTKKKASKVAVKKAAAKKAKSN